jgi:hypothetical protein
MIANERRPLNFANMRHMLIWTKPPPSPVVSVSKEGIACGVLCEVSVCMQRVNREISKMGETRRDCPTATRNAQQEAKTTDAIDWGFGKGTSRDLKYSPVSNERYSK